VRFLHERGRLPLWTRACEQWKPVQEAGSYRQERAEDRRERSGRLRTADLLALCRKGGAIPIPDRPLTAQEMWGTLRYGWVNGAPLTPAMEEVFIAQRAAHARRSWFSTSPPGGAKRTGPLWGSVQTGLPEDRARMGPLQSRARMGPPPGRERMGFLRDRELKGPLLGREQIGCLQSRERIGPLQGRELVGPLQGGERIRSPLGRKGMGFPQGRARLRGIYGREGMNSL
jgi:hypothetical protein